MFERYLQVILPYIKSYIQQHTYDIEEELAIVFPSCLFITIKPEQFIPPWYMDDFCPIVVEEEIVISVSGRWLHILIKRDDFFQCLLF